MCLLVAFGLTLLLRHYMFGCFLHHAALSHSRVGIQLCTMCVSFACFPVSIPAICWHLLACMVCKERGSPETVIGAWDCMYFSYGSQYPSVVLPSCAVWFSRFFTNLGTLCHMAGYSCVVLEVHKQDDHCVLMCKCSGVPDHSSVLVEARLNLVCMLQRLHHPLLLVYAAGMFPSCPCSNVSEAVIFLFLGISLYEARSADPVLIVLSILFCMVFRPLGECLLKVVGCTVGMNAVQTMPYTVSTYVNYTWGAACSLQGILQKIQISMIWGHEFLHVTTAVVACHCIAPYAATCVACRRCGTVLLT